MKYNFSKLHFSSELVSIMTNTFFLWLGVGLSFLFKVVYAIFLARYLGPDHYGKFSYAISLYALLLPFAALGLAPVLSRTVGRDRSDAQRFIDLYMGARLLSVLTSAILYAAVIFSIEDDAAVLPLLTILTGALIARGVCRMTEDLFSAFERAKNIFIVESSARFAEATVGILVLASGFGLLAVIFVHTAIWILQAIYSVYLVFSTGLTFRARLDLRPILGLLRLGFSNLLTALLSTWVIASPLILHRHIVQDPTELGVLAVAMQALAILAPLSWALGRSMIPVFSRMTASGGHGDIAIAENALHIGLACSGISSLIGFAIGPWLVSALFGLAYQGAGILIGPAIGIFGLLLACNVITPTLVARARFGISAILAASGAIVYTVLALLLIAPIGPMGAIVSVAAGFLAHTLGLSIVLRTIVPFRMWHPVMVPILSYMVILIASILVARFTAINEMVSFLGGAFIFAIVEISRILFSKRGRNFRLNFRARNGESISI